MDALKFAIQEEALARHQDQGGGRRRRRLQRRGSHDERRAHRRRVPHSQHRRAGAQRVAGAEQAGHRLQSHQRPGRRLRSRRSARQAALEDTERIIEVLEGADMVFVTAGLGGGTGTGAAPVVASLAKELNALTVAVVTKPFAFEGPRRMKQADRGLSELGGTVDTVITVPNDRLLELVPRGTSFFEAFRIADDILRQAVQGISDIITTPGLINRDFSDIRAIMLGMGYAMMGTASASGENASIEAARQAISSPLMEEGGVKGARGVLINITGSSKLSLHDVNEACSLIRGATANEDAQINFGVVLNEAHEGRSEDHRDRHRIPARQPATTGAPRCCRSRSRSFLSRSPLLRRPSWNRC